MRLSFPHVCSGHVLGAQVTIPESFRPHCKYWVGQEVHSSFFVRSYRKTEPFCQPNTKEISVFENSFNCTIETEAIYPVV